MHEVVRLPIFSCAALALPALAQASGTVPAGAEDLGGDHQAVSSKMAKFGSRRYSGTRCARLTGRQKLVIRRGLRQLRSAACRRRTAFHTRETVFCGCARPWRQDVYVAPIRWKTEKGKGKRTPGSSVAEAAWRIIWRPAGGGKGGSDWCWSRRWSGYGKAAAATGKKDNRYPAETAPVIYDGERCSLSITHFLEFGPSCGQFLCSPTALGRLLQ